MKRIQITNTTEEVEKKITVARLSSRLADRRRPLSLAFCRYYFFIKFTVNKKANYYAIEIYT